MTSHPESEHTPGKGERETLEQIGFREEPTDGEAAEMRWLARKALGWVCGRCDGTGSLLEPEGAKYQACPYCGGSGNSPRSPRLHPRGEQSR